MATLFISDIHADIRGLDAVLSIVRGKEFEADYGVVDRVICLGDLVDEWDQPAMVIERLQGLPNLTCVLGNHDDAILLNIDVGRRNVQSQIAHQEFKANRGHEFFVGLPTRVVDAENRLIFAHGGINDIPARTGRWLDKWVASYMWQRLAYEERYDANYGCHYTPHRSFTTARRLLPQSDESTIIVGGHNHREMAFHEEACGDVVDDMPIATRIKKYQGEKFSYGGQEVSSEYRMRARTIEIIRRNNYLFAIGAVARDPSDGYNTVHFAMLHHGRKKFTMFSFDVR